MPLRQAVHVQGGCRVTFPTPFAGSSALYPVSRTHVRPVRVLEYSNLTEQRWKETFATQRFVLDLRSIRRSDMLAIRTHFDTSKGPFDHTWSITLGGITYANMMYVATPLEHRENEGAYDMQIAIKQVKP